MCLSPHQTDTSAARPRRRSLLFGAAAAATTPLATYTTAFADVRADDARHGRSMLLRNVRVVDGDRVLERGSVLVLGGRIAAVAAAEDLATPRGVEVYDGQGNTALPGLIDAHVHADPEFWPDALRFGVTTELDMFGDPGVLAQARRRRRSTRRTDRADLWSAGVGVTVPGGHPQVSGWDFPRLRDGENVDAFVADRIREGSDYVKIIIDDGGGQLPTLTPEQVRAAARAAHRRGKLAVAHAERLAHARTAVDAGVDGIVHVPIDGPMDDALVTTLARAGIFAVPTVTVIDCGASADRLLADERIRPLLSAAQTYTLSERNPRPCRSSYREHAIANTRRLLRAGVPVLAGTDAPLPGTANGPSLLAAVGYLVEAGMSPTGALWSATGRTAGIFGLGKRGRLRSGHRADIVLVDGDPTREVAALRAISAVFKNGFPIDRTSAQLAEHAHSGAGDGEAASTLDTSAAPSRTEGGNDGTS